MLNDCLIQALKQWINMEPKHSQKIKEIIIDNIEKRKVSIHPEIDDSKDEYVREFIEIIILIRRK